MQDELMLCNRTAGWSLCLSYTRCQKLKSPSDLTGADKSKVNEKCLEFSALPCTILLSGLNTTILDHVWLDGVQGVNLKARDANQDTVLHLAASQSRLNVLKVLVSSSRAALPELLWSRNSVGNTPLHCAASLGNTGCVQTLLLTAGVNPCILLIAEVI